MDSILQLFIGEEILERLGRRRLTGCFHAFTPKESGAIFFVNGVIVAAARGQIEGEEVLHQILDWTDARYVWQPESTAPAPSAKPLKINVEEFLAKRKPRTGVLRKPAHETTAVSHPVIAITSKGKSTGPLPEVAGTKPVPMPSVDLTATKTFNPTAESRAAHDEALLLKFKLVLISTDKPEQRFKLARINNLIGRNPACDIAISHASISRQHCLLQITERGLHVKDLDTTNGTKVNGITMKEGYINVGDRLTVGHLVFTLEKA